MTFTKTNPGSAATETGVLRDGKHERTFSEDNLKKGISATHFHDVKSGSIEPLCLLGEAFNG